MRAINYINFSKQEKQFKILIIVLAIFKFIVHILTANGYGYFIDELYTVALSKHLDFGYVDLPPIVPAILAVSRSIFGESLFALHIVPALTGAATMAFVCLITREMGGKRFAICISGLTFIVAPVWLTMNSFFAYDGFDQLSLSIFFYLLIKYIKSDDKKLWVPLGIIAGIAAMTKATILFYGLGFLIALVVSGYGKKLNSKWPWIGLGLFLIIISPYIVWQMINGWPTLDYWMYYESGRTYKSSIAEYLINIIIIMNPFTLPLWTAGIYKIMLPKIRGGYRFIGVMFIASFMLLFLLSAKAYMLAAFFVPLYSAGAVFVEEKLTIKNMKKIKISIITYVLAAGLALAPASIPILSPVQLTRYFNIFRIINKSVTLDNLPKTSFPQTLADRFGWDNMVDTINRVYRKLPDIERDKCRIFAGYYGAAGAIDLLGKKYSLPNAMSGHLTYYLWGPGDFSGEIMISIGVPEQILKMYFEEVNEEDRVISEYTMPYNTDLPVYICRKSKLNIKDLWANFKYFG